MTPVRSDALVAVEYNVRDRTLLVWFRKGNSLYLYCNVSASLYEELLGAQPHPWGAVGRRLRRYHRCIPMGRAA